MWTDPNTGVILPRKPSKGSGIKTGPYSQASLGKNLKPLKPRIAAILAAIDGTRTFSDIGEEHGVTGEYVRLIAKRFSKATGREFLKQRTAGKKRERILAAGIQSTGSNAFQRRVRLWLAEIGHGYCCQCHGAVPLEKMKLPRGAQCKACDSARKQRWYWAMPEDKRREWSRRHNQLARERKQAKR